MRTLLTAAAVAAAATVLAPSAAAVTGQMPVVYVLASWNGTSPFTVVETQQVAVESDAFFRDSSSGRFSMPGSVAAPIRLARNVFDSCDATVLRDHSPPALFQGFQRAVMIAPNLGACQFHGEANPTEVILNGYLSRSLVVHELGHTLGLGHASLWDCSSSPCAVDEYGNTFSVMGGGQGDFNAFEKSSLGWLSGVVRPEGSGTHTIGAIEAATALPQALVVTAATGEYWFESRGLPTTSFGGDSAQPPGVAVVAGPGGSGTSRYPRANLLLPNPSGGARYAYEPGETFVQRGAFAVAVVSHSQPEATLRFEWLDRTPPGRPRLKARSPRRGRVALRWEQPVERGSGIETYTLLLDGRPVREVDGRAGLFSWNETISAPRGVHRVAVVATDRAGNRGRGFSRRVRVK